MKPPDNEEPTFLNTKVTFEDQIAIRLEKLCLDFLTVVHTFKPSEIKLLSKEVDKNQALNLPPWLHNLAEAYALEQERLKLKATSGVDWKAIIKGLKTIISERDATIESLQG